MGKRKGLSKKTRFEVFKRDSFTCQYCGRSAPEVILHADHIQPVSKDGDDDILNLITSCVDCNSGKGDRLLSDHSALTRQKNQLDELNDRREQLEMMIEWRNGLSDLTERELEAATDEWRSVSGYVVNGNGLVILRKLIKKFGLKAVLDAIQASARYLKVSKQDLRTFTQDSAEQAFNKIGGICQIESLPEWKRELYYVRNIAKSRAGSWWHNSTSAEVLKTLERAYNAGIPIEDLKHLALEGLSYSQITRTLNDWIQEAEGDECDG